MFMDSYRTKIDQYSELCREKSTYHKLNANSAKLWNNLLSTVNMGLSSLMALTMTILTVMEASNISTTIVGAVYAFLITIAAKIQNDYGFISLSYQHWQISDDFDELLSEFDVLHVKLTKGGFSDPDLDHLIVKYNLVVSKSHIQNVRECKGIFCCLKEREIIK